MFGKMVFDLPSTAPDMMMEWPLRASNHSNGWYLEGCERAWRVARLVWQTGQKLQFEVDTAAAIIWLYPICGPDLSFGYQCRAGKRTPGIVVVRNDSVFWVNFWIFQDILPNQTLFQENKLPRLNHQPVFRPSFTKYLKICFPSRAGSFAGSGSQDIQNQCLGKWFLTCPQQPQI